MALVVGNEYYYLSNSDYQRLYADYADLLSDFEKGDDGYWYAAYNAIDEEEFLFLLDEDVANTTYYSTSSQPGGGM